MEPMTKEQLNSDCQSLINIAETKLGYLSKMSPNDTYRNVISGEIQGLLHSVKFLIHRHQLDFQLPSHFEIEVKL